MSGSNPGLLLHPGCHSAASWPSHSGSWAAGVSSWSFSANPESSISAACPWGSASASLHPGPSHHGASAHPSSTSAHAYIRLRPSTVTVLPASMFITVFTHRSEFSLVLISLSFTLICICYDFIDKFFIQMYKLPKTKILKSSINIHRCIVLTTL